MTELEKRIEELEYKVKLNTRWRRFEQVVLCIITLITLITLVVYLIFITQPKPSIF